MKRLQTTLLSLKMNERSCSWSAGDYWSRDSAENACSIGLGEMYLSLNFNFNSRNDRSRKLNEPW